MRRVVLLVLLLGLLPVAARAAGAEGIWRYDTDKMSAEVDQLAAEMVARIGPAKLQAMASRAPMMEQQAAALRARAPGDPRAEARAAGLERMAKMIEAAQGDPEAFFRARLQRLDSPDARLTLKPGGACEALLPGPGDGSQMVKRSCRWSQKGEVVTITSESMDPEQRGKTSFQGPLSGDTLTLSAVRGQNASDAGSGPGEAAWSKVRLYLVRA